jgi:hypothetical protein
MNITNLIMLIVTMVKFIMAKLTMVETYNKKTMVN